MNGRRHARCTFALMLVAVLLLLSACDQAHVPSAIETVHRSPVVFDVIGEGQLQAVEATPLKVPGQGWSKRQLDWLLPEGSHVKKGDVLARFTSQSGQIELAEALIELERNTLQREATRSGLAVSHNRMAVELSQVSTQLGIAQRYANAELQAMARNKVLDAIQDADYLKAKRDNLRWLKGQANARGEAEMSVLGAKRTSVQNRADRARDNMEALELRAPHAGIFMHTANWAGDKPTVGSDMRAGMELGRLPDISALEVELALPQIQAQGVEVGNKVVLSPVGRPEQVVTGTLDWVASAAKVMSRNSPVKYLTMKAKVPAEMARKYGWVPGQQLRARVIVFDDGNALSVANVALRSEAGKHYVQVRHGGGFQRREVELGVRGNARSQVLDGLQAGDAVLLVAAGSADAKSDDETGSGTVETAPTKRAMIDDAADHEGEDTNGESKERQT